MSCAPPPPRKARGLARQPGRTLTWPVAGRGVGRLALLVGVVVGQLVHAWPARAWHAQTLPECRVYPGGSTDPTRPILILLLGWNSSATVDASGTTSLTTGWGNLNHDLADLYRGIVYFSYSRASQAYNQADTYLDIYSQLTPLLRDLIQSCVNQGYTSFDLIGHSLGGVVAMDYIVSHGVTQTPGLVRHVVTLDSPVNGGEQIHKLAFLPSTVPDVLRNQAVLLLGQLFLSVQRGDQTSLAEVAAMYEDRANVQQRHFSVIPSLLQRGTRVATFTNGEDLLILISDALISGTFGQAFPLGYDELTVGHHRILDTRAHPEVLLAIRAELQTAPPPTPTPVPRGPSSGTATVLVFDTSGSMQEADATGQTKLQAAQHAGGSVLEIISAENTVGSQAHQVAVVEFNQLSQLLAPLSPDIAASQAALGRLVANGGTGMAAGLQAAMNTLGPSPSLDPIIILLSDGLPNLSLSGSNFLAPDQVKQEVLDLASQAGQNGQCIYTVGFGVPLGAGQQASIDEAFLRQVAVNSGCGAYYNAQNALELANIYVLLRHASSGGEVLLEEAGQIAQNEQLDIATIDVPDQQSLVLYTLNWPGSRLEPLLRDPAGVTVDANYPGASISVGATVASVVLSNPQPGQWQVGALGVDVPGGQTTYHAVVSSRGGGPLAAPPPTSAGFPLAVFTIVAGGGAVGLYVLWQSNRRRRGLPVGPAPMGAAAPANARLIAATGPLAGQAILVTGGMFTLGRSRSSSLSVPDTLVSRRHAVIRYAQGRWYLQDQGSAAGTFVNGQRIVAAVLNNGDRLRLGSVEFVFVVG